MGSKELLISVPHGVVRNSIVLKQLEEPLAAARHIDSTEFRLIGHAAEPAVFSELASCGNTIEINIAT